MDAAYGGPAAHHSGYGSGGVGNYGQVYAEAEPSQQIMVRNVSVV